jgi:hypothetical protein
MNASILQRFVLALSLVAATFGAALANPAEKPVVHVIAIGDVDLGGDFGKKVAEDARNIVATFEECFAKAGKADQLKTRLMLGTEVTPDTVLEAIAEVKVRPSDTLVVLYSGHGRMDPGNNHVLTFKHGRLERKSLLAAMQAKSLRLAVLLTDCCSSGGVAPNQTVPTYTPKTMKEGVSMEWNTMANLFLRHNGLVDITAAEPGYCGKIDLDKSGSLFTNALVRILKTPHAELVRHLDRDGDSHLQWDEILPQLRGVAAEYDRAQTLKHYNEVVHPQQAYAYSLGRWMPAR